MDLLKSAFNAEIPLIAVYTDDLVNAVDVLQFILGKQPQQLPGYSKQNFAGNSKLFYVVNPEENEATFAKLYSLLVSLNKVCIVINPKKLSSLMFNAGSLPVPKKMLIEHVEAVTEDKAWAEKIVARLGATNLKDVAELLRLTMVNTGSLTPQGVAHTRRALFKSATGLLPVTTDQPLYIPPDELFSWVNLERDYFLLSDEPRLRPRGLLLDGPPGTGKSSGAKYIAEQWGVGCFTLQLGGMKSKWLGESQNNLIAALAMVEREAPCVLLIDEIEKYYGGHGEDGGTSSEMLGQLLWWLAEHRSRVLTVMTTNNRLKLPTELYRPGRIDQVLNIGHLDQEAAFNMVFQIVATFTKDKGKQKKYGGDVADALMQMMLSSNIKDMTAAEVTAFCTRQLKLMKFGL